MLLQTIGDVKAQDNKFGPLINQTPISAPKTESKNSIDRFYIRLDIAEEKFVN